MPAEVTYPLDKLKHLIEQDSQAVVAFYGGEPLLQVQTIKEMIHVLPAKRFVINTNGFFIEQLDDYLHFFDSILLSVDGEEKVTDFYRGPGCYQRVMHALRFLKAKQYTGEIIARMTVSNKTDIFRDVMHLLRYFPFVHWQLDVVWSNLWDLKDFSRWAERSYKPGLQRLVRYWINMLEKGSIVGIVPFLGVMSRLLHGGTGLPCGSGESAIAVTTDGKILACPIAPDYHWNLLGDLDSFTKISIDMEPCGGCEVYDVCGGRCLFTNKERLWGEEGFQEICKTTKFLINELNVHKDKINHMKDKIRYPPFNNTTEIIP